MTLRTNIVPGEGYMGQGIWGKAGSPIKIGKIVRVDNEKDNIDVVWMSEQGGFQYIKIAQPCIGIEGMPKVGDNVVCSMRATSARYSTPVPISYIRLSPDFENTYGLLQSFRRTHNRKLYPGEKWFETESGSEILMDENIQIADSKLDTIKINSQNQCVEENSLSHTTSNAAVRRKEGIVERQATPNIMNYLNDNGVNSYIVTSKGAVWGTDGVSALTESREEFYDESEGILDPFDPSQREINGNPQKPFMEVVAGNVVGNDILRGEEYGKSLRYQLFGSRYDIEPSPAMQIASQDPVDEVKTNALAYLIRLLKSPPGQNPTTVAMDKDGHVSIHIAASSSNPIGESRSLELSLGGTSKIVTGADGTGESFDVYTRGGINQRIGTFKEDGASIHANYEGKVMQTFNAGKDGIARQSIINGDDVEIYNGKTLKQYSGKYSVQASAIEMKSTGYLGLVSANDYHVTCGGSFQETVIGGSKNTLCALGHSLTVAGPGKDGVATGFAKIENIVLGPVAENIIAGLKNINISGALTENIGGLKSTTVGGAITRTCGAAISDTSAGAFAINSGGLVAINSAGAVTVTAASTIALTSPQVLLGPVVTPTPDCGIVTAKSSPCWIVGSPHLGSTTCFASI